MTDKVAFWTTGENFTDLVRDLWTSLKLQAVLAVTDQLTGRMAIDICTGYLKFEGDTRKDPNLSVVVDNTPQPLTLVAFMGKMYDRNRDADLGLLNAIIIGAPEDWRIKHGVSRTKERTISSTTVSARDRYGKDVNIPTSFVRPYHGYRINKGVNTCQTCDITSDDIVGQIDGFSNTDQGWMVLWTCPHCFSKWRFHLSAMYVNWYKERITN